MLASFSLWAAVRIVELPSPTREAGQDVYTYSLASELSVKNADALWLEIPSSDLADTIQIKGKGTKTDRFIYLHKNNGATPDTTRRIDYKTTYQDIIFTASDIKTEGEKYYLVFSTKDDYKIQTDFAKLAIPGAECSSPTIEWDVEPVNGIVGTADFQASVATTPAEHAVVWTSSNEAVATVTDGKIHYVAGGLTTITASLTYIGDDYCKTTVSVSKDIFVPIDTVTLGQNDLRWYYTTAAPASSPDNGLNFKSSANGNGLYGVKLNSDGYAWFAKPAVAGKLRVGAYYKSANTIPYEVNVYSCDADGKNKSEVALGALSTAFAGTSSPELAVDANVAGIYIARKTSSEGVLYFVEFIAEKKETPTSIDNTNVENAAVKRIVNGQLIIEKNGEVYNVLGARVR